MKEYAVIASDFHGEWMGLVNESTSYHEYLSWRKRKYSPVSYSREWLILRKVKSNIESGGYKKVKRSMRLHLDYVPGVFFSSVSNSIKADNYWVYGDTPNLYAYRLAKHLLAKSEKFLPEGFSARVYRVGSKEMNSIVK